MSTTAQVLIKLLDKVPDSKKLEILLEPENLLELLQIYGQNKDELGQRLTSGTIPGELLLELLDKEPDADRLLAQIGNPTAKSDTPKSVSPKTVELPKNPEPAQPSSSPVKVSTPEDIPARMATPVKAPVVGGNLLGTNYWLVVLVIFSLTAIIPAMMATGFMGKAILSTSTATIIAIVGGAVAGAIADYGKKFSWMGVVVGITYEVVTLWAAIFYFEIRTTPIFKFELAIPIFIGAFPALGVYLLLSKLFPKKL